MDPNIESHPTGFTDKIKHQLNFLIASTCFAFLPGVMCTYQTLAGNADVGALLFVAFGSVDDFASVTVVEPLALRHTVELALVGGPCVRHPSASSSLQTHQFIKVLYRKTCFFHTRRICFRMEHRRIGNTVPTGNLACLSGTPKGLINQSPESLIKWQAESRRKHLTHSQRMRAEGERKAGG